MRRREYLDEQIHKIIHKKGNSVGDSLHNFEGKKTRKAIAEKFLFTPHICPHDGKTKCLLLHIKRYGKTFCPKSP